MQPNIVPQMREAQFLPEIEAFLATIEPIEHAYTIQYFSFACSKFGATYKLLQGRVDLTCGAPLPDLPTIETSDLIVGRVDIRSLGLSLREMLNNLLRDKLRLAVGDITLTLAKRGPPTEYNPFQEPNPGERIDLLHIFCEAPTAKLSADLDWQLRVHNPPYDGFAEVASIYGLSPDPSRGGLRLIAQQVLLIDAASCVAGDLLDLRLRLSPGADFRNVKVGCRAMMPGPVVLDRFTLVGSDFEWRETAHGVFEGNLSRKVQHGAVVHCSATYASCGQHRWYVSDPHSVRNSARVATEVFDEGLQTLAHYLEGKGKNPGPNFEAAVADLLSLFGFQVLHLSGANRSKSPDLVARVPFSGDLILVECTTDTLKGDNKLGKLFARAVEVKEKLVASSLGNTRVLPVIVTCLPKHQIEADISEAERLGIGVIDQEDLREAARRTVLLNDPAQLFEEGFKKMLSAREKKPDGH